MKKENSVIEKFLQNYPVKSTSKSYRSVLKLFFNVINKDPETYFTNKQDYEGDVQKLWRHLNGKPPKSINLYMAAIKMFLSENDHELSSKFWRTLHGRTKGTRAVTEDKIPKPEEMKRIIAHADVRGRALFLTLLQSGMRIGELIKIDTDDIDFDSKPTKIRIRSEITKSGNQRYCFIGTEATESIKAYLVHRQTYLDSSINRARKIQEYYHAKPKSNDDPRLFPYDGCLVRNIWNRLLRNAKLGERDKRTKFHKMHPHVLRKYYRTHMSLDVPLDVVEALMGHEGYLTEAYRRYSIEQLGEQYLKGEKNISIFETPADLNGINESLKEKDEQMKKMQDRINNLEEFKMKILEQLAIETAVKKANTAHDK
jgi:integrase